MKRLARVGVLGVAAFVLGGCQLYGDLVVNRDGSGSYRYTVALDKAFIAQIGSNPLATIDTQAKSAPYPIKIEHFTTSQLEGVRMTVNFSSAADLKKKMSLGSTTQNPSLLNTFDLRGSGDRWQFAASGSDPTKSSVDQAGSQVDTSAIYKTFDMRFSIRLPGHPRASNATTAVYDDGATTFTWKVTPGTAAFKMNAATDSDVPWLLLALVVVVLIGAAGVGGYLYLARRSLPLPAPPATPGVIP